MAKSCWRKQRISGLRRQKKRLLLVVLFLAALVFVAEWQLTPTIHTVALQQAHNTALSAINQVVQEEIAQQPESFDYQNLMHIERDGEGRITLLVPDTMLLNSLVATMVVEIKDSLDEITQQKLSLPLGAVTGSSILADLGPEIRFGFRTQGVPVVSVEDDFISAGINQVRHRIFLRVESEIWVVVPFFKDTSTVTATVLLSEGIIVGYTPDTYVDLSGF